MRVFLAAYTFRLRKVGQKENFLRFGDAYGTATLLDILEEYLNKIKRDHEDDTSRQYLHSATKLNPPSEGYISGFLESGQYGDPGPLVDRTSRVVTYEMKVNDARMREYFFLIYAPPHRGSGCLIVERRGNRGVYTIFQKSFHDYLRDRYKLTLDLREYIPEDVKKYYQRGAAKKISVHQPKEANDMFEHFDMEKWGLDGGVQADDVEIEVIIKAKPNQSLPLVDSIRAKIALLVERKKLSRNATPVVIDDDGDVITVTFEHKERQQTFNIGSSNRILATKEITEDLVKADGKTPEERILAVSKRYSREIIQTLGDHDAGEN